VRCRVVDGVGWGSEGMDREVGWEGEGGVDGPRVEERLS